MSWRDAQAIEEGVPGVELAAPRVEVEPYTILAKAADTEAKVFGVSWRQAELSGLELSAGRFLDAIVSGGDLTSALKKYGLAEKIDHISTAGGALVLHLTGEKLPMIKALEDAAIKYRTK